MNEYGFFNSENICLKKVICSSPEHAYKKLLFLYPEYFFCIEIKLLRKNIEI